MRSYGRSRHHAIPIEPVHDIPKKTSLHSYFPTITTASPILHSNEGKNIVKSPKSVQLYFQNDADTFHQCPQCGMAFQSSIEQDRIQHEKFHSKHLLMEIQWNESRSEHSLRCFIPSLSQTCTIYHYHSINLLSNRKRNVLLDEIMPRIEEEIGATALKISTDMLVFIMSIQHIVSIFICEYIDNPDRKLGILRMWTHRIMRRKGIASFFLTKIINILNISSDRLLFSNPTFHGLEFAKAFLRMKNDSLVPIYSAL